MILHDYAAYNVWANKRIAKMVASLSDDQFYREIKSSFPSILSTVQHIVVAESIWQKRIIEINPTALSEFSSDRKEIMVQLVDQSEELMKAVHSRSDEQLIKPIAFQDTRGNSFVLTGEEMAHHCINHSTFHRGQLMMMFRQVDIDSVEGLDFTIFLRSRMANT